MPNFMSLQMINRAVSVGLLTCVVSVLFAGTAAAQEGARPAAAATPLAPDHAQLPGSVATPLLPNPRVCPPKALAKANLFSARDSGEMIEGPTCVGIIVNVLRYSVEIGRSVSYSAGPSLTAGFTPPTAGAGGGITTPGDLATAVQMARIGWRARDLANNNNAGVVSQSVARLKALVSTSDDLFRTNGPTGVLAAKNSMPIQDAIANANFAEWTPTDDIVSQFRTLQDSASDLLLGTLTDAQRTQVTSNRTELTSLIAEATPSMASGEKTIAFNKQKALATFWDTLLAGLTVDSFRITTYVSCGVAFNRNTQIAVKLFQYDRLPMFEGNAVNAEAKDPFVTVTCASPFSVTAGVELRFLGNDTFGVVSTGNPATNHFGVTDSANTQPMPIGMVHARLVDFSDNRYALHASFGVAARLTGVNSGGSGAEYLSGLSLSLFRTMYFTAGWHLGRVAELGGGYAVGDAVPSGVTTVPVQTSYQHGFGLAITFTKP